MSYPKRSNREIVIKTITELSIGPMVAALFVFLLIAMAVMAVGRSKDNPIEMCLLGLGVATQSFFGFVVWRLGERQFKFTRDFAERQNRLELYPHRRETLRNLQSLEDIAYSNVAMTSEDFDKIHSTCIEISHVFGDKIGEAAFAFEEAAARWRDTRWTKGISIKNDEQWEREVQYHERASHDMASYYLETLNRIELEIPLLDQTSAIRIN